MLKHTKIIFKSEIPEQKLEQSETLGHNFQKVRKKGTEYLKNQLQTNRNLEGSKTQEHNFQSRTYEQNF